MDFRILGPLDVRDGDQVVELAGGKQRALLALLIVNANETISTDRIVEELWGEQSPQTAPKVIQNHVSQLRRGLGDGLLLTEGAGYRLRLEPGSLDADRFERLFEEGRSALEAGNSGRAGELLREALALWRGTPLAEVAFEPFAQAEIARLEERRLVALEERIEADLALGRHDDLVGELEALIVKHPLRERLRRQLLLALYRSGRQSEALAAYQDARRALVEELGIEPGRPLRDLQQAILNQDPALELDAGSDSPADATRGVFVGRSHELSLLLAGLGDALSGRGRLVLLIGEPGIGKSRLAEELVHQSRARGATVLSGRSWEAGGAPAYWPWVQVLRAYVRDCDLDALRSHLGAGAPYLAQILPELRDRLEDLAEPVSLESDGDRFRLFDALTEFLDRASRDSPIVIVLDDLHAADASSLVLLQFVTRALSSMHVLVVGIARNVDPVPAEDLNALLGELTREPVTRRLSLGGLSREEIAEYVESSFEIASSAFVDALHEETEGNPLFVTETVSLLAAEGTTLGDAAITIPESVRDVISRRLARLSEECNRVLLLASILGREFTLDGLARISGVEEPALLETLDEAMVARVVVEAPGVPGRLRFAHVVTRDTLYEGLTGARRAQLHRRALNGLEELYGSDSSAHLPELAFHAAAANEREKALAYARKAGDRALVELAYEDAARHFGAALDALVVVAPGDEPTRCNLLLSRGLAEARAGELELSRQTFLAAAAIARRLGLTRELAQAAVGYGAGHMWSRAGSDPHLVPLLEEGLRVVGPDEAELRTRLLARLAGALRDEHSRSRRDALSREAVELARRTGSPSALAYALDGRTGAIIAPDTLDECLELSAELCAVSKEIGDREQLSQGHDCSGVAYSVLGDTDRAEAEFAAARAVAEGLGQPAKLWQTKSSLAAVMLATGRLDEGEELSSAAYELGRRAQPEMAIPVYELQRFTLCDHRGALEDVEPAVRGLVASYPRRPALRCVLAYVNARIGRWEEAMRTLGELASDRFSVVPFDQEWLLAMSLLAETAALVRDDESGLVLYELLQPWAHLHAANPAEGIRGSISRSLGLLAAAAGQLSHAEGHFDHALETNARAGLRPWLAETEHDYASMLLERGDPGDEERAGLLRSSAQATADELGLHALAASLAALSS
jgi:DNA-binding SARP family transcriptional activator